MGTCAHSRACPSLVSLEQQHSQASCPALMKSGWIKRGILRHFQSITMWEELTLLCPQLDDRGAASRLQDPPRSHHSATRSPVHQKLMTKIEINLRAPPLPGRRPGKGLPTRPPSPFPLPQKPFLRAVWWSVPPSQGSSVQGSCPSQRAQLRSCVATFWQELSCPS